MILPTRGARGNTEVLDLLLAYLKQKDQQALADAQAPSTEFKYAGELTDIDFSSRVPRETGWYWGISPTVTAGPMLPVGASIGLSMLLEFFLDADNYFQMLVYTTSGGVDPFQSHFALRARRDGSTTAWREL